MWVDKYKRGPLGRNPTRLKRVIGRMPRRRVSLLHTTKTGMQASTAAKQTCLECSVVADLVAKHADGQQQQQVRLVHLHLTTVRRHTENAAATRAALFAPGEIPRKEPW